MKKFLCLILALLLVFGLTGCGEDLFVTYYTVSGIPALSNVIDQDVAKLAYSINAVASEPIEAPTTGAIIGVESTNDLTEITYQFPVSSKEERKPFALELLEKYHDYLVAQGYEEAISAYNTNGITMTINYGEGCTMQINKFTEGKTISGLKVTFVTPEPTPGTF